MNLLVALLAFIPAICIVIVIHELGHYTAARLCGVKVLRFSLGMGKILFSRKFRQDGTEWALSLIPIGGYVKLLDARSEDMTKYPAEAMNHEFTSRNVWQRILIAAAGPAANFLLAIVLLFGLFLYGIPHPSAKLRAVPVATVAYKSGLRGGEVITSIDGQQIEHWGQIKGAFAQAILDRQPSINLCWRTEKQDERCQQVSISHLNEDSLNKSFLDELGLMVNRPPAILKEIEKAGPAQKSGLLQGDLITAINNHPIADSLALIEYIRKSPGQHLVFSILRNGNSITIPVVAERFKEKDADIGRIGVRMNVSPEIVSIQYNAPSALVESISKTFETAYLTVKSIGQMIIGDISVKNITGPVTIADYAGKTARAGWITYISFIVFISISIGIMNLLPIPVLDGGLLLYYAVEVIKGSSVSEKVSRIGTVVGLGMLGLLMVVALFNDIGRLFV